jgi:hypothetical protein
MWLWPYTAAELAALIEARNPAGSRYRCNQRASRLKRKAGKAAIKKIKLLTHLADYYLIICSKFVG